MSDKGDERSERDAQSSSSSISDSEIGAIAGGASISFGGRAAGALLKFGAQLIIALWLGAELFGHYALGFAVYEFAQLVAGLGLLEGVVRFASIYREKDDFQRLKGVLVRGLQLPFVAGLVVGAVLFLGADYFCVQVFDKPALSPVLKIFAVAVPFGSTMNVAAYATTSREISQYLVLIRELIHPGINAALVLFLLWIGLGLDGAVGAWVGACVVGMVAGIGFLRRLFPVLRDDLVAPLYETKALVKFSLPLALGNASWLVMLWTDVLILGFLASADQVGIYRAVSQTALTIVLFLRAINTIFGPMIARQYASGNVRRLQSTFHTATRWGLLLSLPVYLVMIAAPADLLNLFGSEFRVGATALAILATGQLVNAGTGGVGYVLTMSGHEVQKMVGDVTFAIINIILNLFFIPRWGILGAATATSLSIAGLNILRVLQVYWGIGIHAYSSRYIKLFLAGGAAYASTLFVRALFLSENFLVTLTTTGCIIMLVYSISVWVTGFEREDDVVIDKLRGLVS